MSLTRQSFIDRAVETALVGLDQDKITFRLQDGLVEVMATNAVQDFAIQIAHDPENFSLLQKLSVVVLVSGQGNLPSDILPESLRNGSVVDGDGNILSRVEFLNDLSSPRSPLLGYYALVNDSIYTRQLSSGSLTDTNSPLLVTGNYIPDMNSLAADVPLVIQSDLVTFLANRIRASMGVTAG